MSIKNWNCENVVDYVRSEYIFWPQKKSCIGRGLIIIGVVFWFIGSLFSTGWTAEEAQQGPGIAQPGAMPKARVLQPDLKKPKMPSLQQMDASTVINASFTPTDPSKGSTWFRKGTYTITWNKLGWIKTNVKISLFQGGNLVNTIASSTSNSGSFSWTIPGAIVPGEYVIKVQTVDNKYGADSDNFSIAANIVTKKVSVPLKGSNSICVCEKTVSKTCPEPCACQTTDTPFGSIRAGLFWFHNSDPSTHIILCEVFYTHMGWVLFELPKLPTSNVKATLKYGLLSSEIMDKDPTSADGFPPPSCPVDVYAATNQWTGVTTPLTSLASEAGFQIDVSSQVRTWLSGSQPNFGFVFKPHEPWKIGRGDTYIQIFGNFLLEIEYEEEG